jgi:hypothetical protein
MLSLSADRLNKARRDERLNLKCLLGIMLRISTSRLHPLCSYNNLIPSHHLVGLRCQIQGETKLDKRLLTGLMSFERKYKRSTRDRNDDC